MINSLDSLIVLIYIRLSTVAYLSQTVLPHETALIDMSHDTIDGTFTSVLPNGIIAVIGQDRLAIAVLRYHQGIAINNTNQIFIVKVRTGVEKGFLLVGFFYHLKESGERIAECLSREPAAGFDVDHGYKVLVARLTLGHEVGQLLRKFSLWTKKVVGSDLQTILVGKLYVLRILVVDIVAAFGGLQINVSHLGVLTNGLPKHFALIVTQVNSVNVRARIFTFHVESLC